MPKRIVQDIVPRENRSIRDIPIDVTRRDYSYEPLKYEKFDEGEIMVEEKNNKIKERPIIKKGGSKKLGVAKKIFGLFLLITICIAIIIFAFSLFFSKINVSIKPKTSDVSVNGTYTARKDGDVLAKGQISYIPISVTKEMSGTVPSKNGPKIDVKAKGKVTLFNNHSSSAQKIVATTRLQTGDGRIYRTQNDITIPGRTISGGRTIPGSVDVNVLADATGDRYNIKATELTSDLKIVAYKGTDKYDTFYGKIKTDITGGYSGFEKIIDPEAKKITEAELIGKMQIEMIDEIKNKITDEYVIYNQALIKKWDISEPRGKDENNAIITIKGEITALSIKKDSLIKMIAPTEIESYTNYGYRLEGLENLDFTMINKTINIEKGDLLNFKLSGNVKIIGSFNEDKLKSELGGIDIKDAEDIFIKYGTISEVDVVIKPFWKRSFPKNIDRIVIETKS